MEINPLVSKRKKINNFKKQQSSGIDTTELKLDHYFLRQKHTSTFSSMSRQYVISQYMKQLW